MRVRFRAGLVDRFEGCPRQLELPARLQADRSAVRPLERDQLAVIEAGLPTEMGLHSFQECTNAAITLIGHRFEQGFVERKLLVLGADAPVPGRLGAGRDPFDELIEALDGGVVAGLTRHGPSPLATSKPVDRIGTRRKKVDERARWTMGSVRCAFALA